MVGADGRLPLPWIADPLREALVNARAHALLLEAQPGDGSLEFATTLAQAWLCESSGDDRGKARPCGRCEGCRLAFARTHPDLDIQVPEVLAVERNWPVEIDSSRKPSRQIRIEPMRAAMERLSRSSARGRAKVLVLHPADALNTTSASALLKTLEEPAAGVRILLSTPDSARLLPTVRSRCQRVAWHRPSAEQALAWLNEEGVADAGVLMAACGGLPLEALGWHRAGVSAKSWSQWPTAVLRGEEGAWAGWSLQRMVDALQRLCHDAMAVASGGGPRFFPPGTVPEQGGLAALAAWSETLKRMARHVGHPWNEGLAIEALVAEGRQALAPPSRRPAAEGSSSSSRLATLR